MTKQTYEKISKPFRKTEKRKNVLRSANRILTIMVYVAYPIALYVAFERGMLHFVRAVLIPGVSFVLLSIFRSWYHAPRPYEELQIEPIIEKDTVGKSFPSRHVFSAFIIDAVIGSLSKTFGILYFVIALAIAVIRVIGGVHYPKDVAAGGIIGMISWFVGKFLFSCFL